MGQQLADSVNSLARCARMAVNHWFLLGWSGDGFFLPYLPGRSFATVSFHTVKYLLPILNLALAYNFAQFGAAPLEVTVQVKNNQPQKVQVGGNAVIVFQTNIQL